MVECVIIDEFLPVWHDVMLFFSRTGETTRIEKEPCVLLNWLWAVRTTQR